MRKTFYEELLLKTKDLVADELESFPALREILTPNSELDDQQADVQFQNGYSLMERVGELVLPYDTADAEILRILREEPAIISFENAAPAYTIKQITVDCVRYRLMIDMFAELGVPYPGQDESIPDPGSRP